MTGAAPFLDAPYAGATYDPATPLDIATMETAIIGQLQQFLGASLGRQMIEIAHFPDRPKLYELRHPIGAALVCYAGSTYEKIDDIGHVIQDREMLWDIGVLMRDLGWAYGGPSSGMSPGAYQVIDLIRQALLGFRPSKGFTPMRLVYDRFLRTDSDAAVWVWDVRFATRSKVVEHHQIPTFPLFIRGTMLEEGGQTAIEVALERMTFVSDTIFLPQHNIQALIIKSQDLTITYADRTDYTLDNVNGIITRTTNSNINSGDTVAISYGYADVVEALASGGSAPLAPHN